VGTALGPRGAEDAAVVEGVVRTYSSIHGKAKACGHVWLGAEQAAPGDGQKQAAPERQGVARARHAVGLGDLPRNRSLGR
jgi:hypothetical protein